jgi:hypothetical protein
MYEEDIKEDKRRPRRSITAGWNDKDHADRRYWRRNGNNAKLHQLRDGTGARRDIKARRIRDQIHP